MSGQWKDFVSQLGSTLETMRVTDSSRTDLPTDAGMEEWTQKSLTLRENGRTVFLVGNGASASMASHFATDVAKNAGIRTQVFTDLSLITAVSNDISYEDSFSEPLGWYMKKGDMLVAISSSGNSPNVVKAVKKALEMEGTVVTLSAMREDNAIRQLGHLNFYLPGDTYGMAETGHAAILHCWMDSIEIK